jgi:fucose 4-O-acetylase-like acetyltransferase
MLLLRLQLPAMCAFTPPSQHLFWQHLLQNISAAAGRRSKLLAIAETFAVAVITAIEGIVSAARTSGSNPGTQGSSQRPVRQVYSGALPHSIVANREPYMQGDWRREPYIPRFCLFPGMLLAAEYNALL